MLEALQLEKQFFFFSIAQWLTIGQLVVWLAMHGGLVIIIIFNRLCVPE